MTDEVWDRVQMAGAILGYLVVFAIIVFLVLVCEGVWL